MTRINEWLITTYCRKNLNCSIEESLKRFEKVCEVALENMVRVRGYVLVFAFKNMIIEMYKW